MTPAKKWLITLGLSLAAVLGYTASTLQHRARPAEAPGAAAAAGRPGSRPVAELQDREGRSLPEAVLIGPDESRLPEDALRRGRVMLVLLTAECGACKKEAEFLRTVVGRRRDITYYGVASFEQDEASIRKAEGMFPFRVFRDDRLRLMQGLNLSRVPIKIYLEDGVIKKTWDGATMDERAKAEFVEWLDGLS